MPPKKQTGGLIDPMTSINVIKASKVHMLNTDSNKFYDSKNYMNGGAKTNKKSQKPTSTKKVKSTKKKNL